MIAMRRVNVRKGIKTDAFFWSQMTTIENRTSGLGPNERFVLKGMDSMWACQFWLRQMSRDVLAACKRHRR